MPEANTTAWKVDNQKVTPTPWDGNPLGKLLIFEEPQACHCRKRHEYVIGVDPSHGLAADNAVISVLKKGNLSCSDETVAEFAGDVDPISLAPLCNTIGRMYEGGEDMSEALMSIECNLTITTQAELRTKYSYSNFFIWKRYDRIRRMFSNELGWWTTPRTRGLLVVKGMKYLREKLWIVHSPYFLDEMADFEKYEGRMAIKAAYGAKDDRIMAGFISLFTAHDLEFQGESEVALAREREASVLTTRDESEVKTGKKTDFQNCDISYEEMLEQQ